MNALPYESLAHISYYLMCIVQFIITQLDCICFVLFYFALVMIFLFLIVTGEFKISQEQPMLSRPHFKIQTKEKDVLAQ